MTDLASPPQDPDSQIEWAKGILRDVPQGAKDSQGLRRWAKRVLREAEAELQRRRQS